MDTNNDIKFSRDQLYENVGRWPQICQETGLDYSWLTKFAQGKIADPGYSKIMTLAKYFRSAKT